MEAVKRGLSYSVDGEFVCDLARRWFWDEEREYEKCEQLLLSCLMSDQITLEEKKQIVVEILEGRKKLVGVNTLSLVEDGERVRPLYKKIQELRKKELIRRISDDMERRPLAYVDRYSCPKNPDEYEPVSDLIPGHAQEVREAFGDRLDPITELRLWAYSNEVPLIRSSRLQMGFWNDAAHPFLDNGLYLLERPEMVYDLIGGPVSDSAELESRLFDYFQKLIEEKKMSDAATLEMIHRNRIYKTAVQANILPGTAEPARPGNSDQLNRKTDPDDFLSEYGLIDRLGNYYSCSFGGHHTKAHFIILKRNHEYLSFDEALDRLYSEGWAIVRNPDPCGGVFFDFRGDMRPTKKQIDAAFTHMIKFNERTLPGVEKYLDE